MVESEAEVTNLDEKKTERKGWGRIRGRESSINGSVIWRAAIYWVWDQCFLFCAGWRQTWWVTTKASDPPNKPEAEPPESSSTKNTDVDGTSSETGHHQKQIEVLLNSYSALEQVYKASLRMMHDARCTIGIASIQVWIERRRQRRGQATNNNGINNSQVGTKVQTANEGGDRMHSISLFECNLPMPQWMREHLAWVKRNYPRQ